MSRYLNESVPEYAGDVKVATRRSLGYVKSIFQHPCVVLPIRADDYDRFGSINSPMQKHTGGLRTPPALRKTPQQGAATSVLLAASPLLDGVGGRYFEDCNEAAVVFRRPTDF